MKTKFKNIEKHLEVIIEHGIYLSLVDKISKHDLEAIMQEINYDIISENIIYILERDYGINIEGDKWLFD